VVPIDEDVAIVSIGLYSFADASPSLTDQGGSCRHRSSTQTGTHFREISRLHVMREHIGVVYLYRFAEGPNPVIQFLRSYQEYRGAIPHDFYVIFKGFPNPTSLASARALFGELPVHSIELDDSGYDIGSYLAAAGRVKNDRLVFLNTFSHLVAGDWLVCLDRASRPERVGVVGATGSWTSNVSIYDQAARDFLSRVRQRLQYWKVYSNDAGTQTNVGPNRQVSLRNIVPLSMKYRAGPGNLHRTISGVSA
jgi:hypothetical protein